MAARQGAVLNSRRGRAAFGFIALLGFDGGKANMAAKNPLGRPGLPGDTASVCAWLASDDAVSVTGEAINVSGGEEMH